MKSYIYGVDVGGTNIKIGIFHQQKLELIESLSVETPTSGYITDVANAIYEAIINLNTKLGVLDEQVHGIGIGMPCVISKDVLIACPNLVYDTNQIIPLIQKQFKHQLKIRVANDANVAALGESKALEKPYENVVLFTLGTGVGGGIIVNGKLIEGRGSAGEIGHILVKDDETMEACGCGKKGCLEQFCGTKGMLSYTKDLMKYQESIIKEMTIKAIFDAAKLGDEVGLKVVDRTAYYLSIAMTNIALMIEPEAFIIGGGIAASGDFLLDKIKKNYERLARFNTSEIKIILAKLGNSAGLYGAANLVD